MANQGRGRSAITVDRTVHKPLNLIGDGDFTYAPLDTSVDGIRLCILEPRTAKGDVLRCRLEHVTFGQMPKYEALSYTWGSRPPQSYILLNGNKFPVRDNLRNALLQLQMPSEERVLWIDAVCINQEDISERNEQVRIMPHIYSRAQIVLVWLGIHKIPGNSKTWRDVMDSGLTFAVLSKMSAVDYWERVWIVQELGKARRLTVHYNKIQVEWETFIKAMRVYFSSKDCMPLKLADQMLDRYGAAYKLENLLITHQEASCKDVRDKIYGFTGLANDTYGRLTMDYGKTLVEVWSDVVRFRNADSTISQHDILGFAKFTRGLLGRDLIAHSNDMIRDEDIARDQNGTLLYGDQRDKLVLCPARLWGRIASVGPTYNDIRGNLRKVDEWTASIKDHVSDQYLQSAYEENDMLLQLLEDIDPSDFEMVSPLSPEMTYDLSVDQRCAINILLRQKSWSSTWGANETPKPLLGDRRSDKHLILLDVLPHNEARKLGAATPFMGIALAPPNASIGDLVCCFHQTERAVLVRKRTMDSFSIIASAVFPDLRAMASEKAKTDRKPELKLAILNNGPLESTITVDLCMDLRSVYDWSV